MNKLMFVLVIVTMILLVVVTNLFSYLLLVGSLFFLGLAFCLKLEDKAGGYVYKEKDDV